MVDDLIAEFALQRVKSNAILVEAFKVGKTFYIAIGRADKLPARDVDAADARFPELHEIFPIGWCGGAHVQILERAIVSHFYLE